MVFLDIFWNNYLYISTFFEKEPFSIHFKKWNFFCLHFIKKSAVCLLLGKTKLDNFPLMCKGIQIFKYVPVPLGLVYHLTWQKAWCQPEAAKNNRGPCPEIFWGPSSNYPIFHFCFRGPSLKLFCCCYVPLGIVKVPLSPDQITSNSISTKQSLMGHFSPIKISFVSRSGTFNNLYWDLLVPVRIIFNTGPIKPWSLTQIF